MPNRSNPENGGSKFKETGQTLNWAEQFERDAARRGAAASVALDHDPRARVTRCSCNFDGSGEPCDPCERLMELEDNDE